MPINGTVVPHEMLMRHSSLRARCPLFFLRFPILRAVENGVDRYQVIFRANL